MSSRIHRSWRALAEPLVDIDTTDARIAMFRDWLLASARSVSTIAAQALDASPPVQWFLACPTEDVPACSMAESALLGVFSYEPPRDPAAFADKLAWLCQRLRVYQHPDVACPHCQGDLEAWTDDGDEIFWICSMMDHRAHLTDSERDDVKRAPEGLRPAIRGEILRAYPDVVFARDLHRNAPRPRV